ncbi:MAG: amidohydrolase family protein, partial [Anaerolineae bacterium]|nr:amidohydrolase family protein [Anaerolineae bacterium]
MAQYRRLLRVAKGDEPADLVIRNAQLLNVLTRDIHLATIGICEDTIAYVTEPEDDRCDGLQVMDATGMWVTPGLIDSHMHIESTHVTPDYFANAVVPRGVTTVAQDPHEMANVLGIEGVEYMIRASRGLPLRVLTFVPTCVPSVPSLETSGAFFGAKEVNTLLDNPNTIGLAEVMDYWGVIRQAPRTTEIVKAGRRRGVILTGHIRGLGGRELNTYLAAGIDSDHEHLTPEGILARSRLGMTVEICCASHRDNVAEAVESWRQRGSLEDVVFVTDDVPPHALVKEGHLDRGVRRAIALGMKPVDAVRAATLTPARRLRRLDLGVVAPGRTADLLVLSDLQSFEVHLTIYAGRIVAKDGKMIKLAQPACEPPERALMSVRLEPFCADDFTIRGPGRRVTAQVLTQQGRGKTTRVFNLADGIVPWSQDPDLALATVWHRHGQNNNHSAVLISGTGLRTGALATTYAHDCHNLVVLGTNPKDMAIAANVLISTGGGYVAVSEGRVQALAALPIAGVLAERPVTELARDFQSFIEAAAGLGITDDPIG